MAQFSYNDYVKFNNNKSNTKTTNFPKIGYFKLADDGDEAVVRICLSDISELIFATVHDTKINGKYKKIGCLNKFGSNETNCPLCKAAAITTDNSVAPARKKVYIKMLAAYKDKATGVWSEAIPVIWERPAGFSKDIATYLRDYGDLKAVLLKITRNGKAGDTGTTYNITYAMPTIFKPEMVSTDFSAFDTLDISKFAYWSRPAEDIETYLTTGAFPIIEKTDIQTETKAKTEELKPEFGKPVTEDVSPWTADTNIMPTVNNIPEQKVQQTPPIDNTTEAVKESTETPRNFSTNRFSF